MACLESRSTMTRISVNPLEVGKDSMRSMDIDSQGRSGIGSCLRYPKGLCRGTLIRLQVVQELQ